MVLFFSPCHGDPPPYHLVVAACTGRTSSFPVAFFRRFSGSVSPARMESNAVKSVSMRGSTRFKLLVPLVLLALFLACRCASDWQQRRYHDETTKTSVRFVYLDPQAAMVCVAGNFNGWSQVSGCMIRAGDAWSFVTSLPPGRYQYAFVIDGRIWREDPGAVLNEDDGFGMKNSVLIVE